MCWRRWLLVSIIPLFCFLSYSQKIVYSEPGKDDTRRMNFEIAGKINSNFLIYKNTRVNKHVISVLDNDMKEKGSADLDFLPANDKMINIDFFPYSDFCYLIFQYQKKNVVYCMGVKIDGMGKKTGEVAELDTTHIGFAANNRIYTVITSEDKGKIMVFKINSRNKQLFVLSTVLLNDKLEILKKSRLSIKMEDRNEYLSDFLLDNDGDLFFSRFFRNSNDNISNATLIIKNAFGDSLIIKTLNIEKTWLDEIHIKTDNNNKRILLVSFYVKERKGNIDGYYYYVWDKLSAKPVLEGTSAFSDELRREARGDAGIKTAFNDHFIRNLIIRKDGGFILGSECYYTTSRFNNWNRWDYLYGSSYMNSYDYYYSPYYNNFWWRGNRFNNQAVRQHADNIVVLSFDSKGQQEWNNIMGKSQYDDESDNLLSYQMMNTGGQLHFLFNLQERRSNLLTDFSITPDGQLTRNPTLKNLDKGYDFMPKYAKQVSARQMIIPCQYRNYICFAKIEYN